MARVRANRVCSMEKRNVMKSGVLWNEVVTATHAARFPDVELSHMLADAGGMQLVRAPKQFDVIVTDNLFGDMLSDVAAMLTGSLGMLPSASLGAPDPKTGRRRALYEPVHGSAPDIAGQGKANPIACILSFAMALRYSFDAGDEADRLEAAVETVLADGLRTADLVGPEGGTAGLDLGDGRRDRRGARRAMSDAAAPVHRSANLKGALYALLAFGVYSTHDVVVKALGGTYSPFQIVFFANLFGFPIVTLMLMRDPVDGNLRPRHPWWSLLRTGSAVLSTTLVFYAFSVLPMAQTYALIFAAPLLDHHPRDPDPRRDRRLAAAGGGGVGLLGVMVVLRPGTTDARRPATSRRWPRGLLGDRRGRRAQDRPRGAQRGAAALPDGGELPDHGLRPALRLPADAGGRRRRADADGLPRVSRGALPHHRLPHRQRRRRRADAVFADPLGGALRRRLLRRDARTGAPRSGRRSSSCRGIYVVFREDRGVSKSRPVLETRSRFVTGTYPRISSVFRLFRRDH